MKSNTYLQIGGGKIDQLHFLRTDVNPSTYTCGRLSAMMQKVAFVVSILFLLVACQKAEQVPSEPVDINTHATENEKVSDSTKVNVDCDAEDWEGSIDVGFGGES